MTYVNNKKEKQRSFICVASLSEVILQFYAGNSRFYLLFI